MHGHRIDQLVLQGDVREFLAADPRSDITPQARGLQHVGLVHRGDLAAAGLRQPERGAHDALDLAHAVAAQVAGAIGSAGLLTEIDAAGQLTHDDEVHAFQQFGLDRRGAERGRVRAHRAQVGVQPQRLADRQQALFGADLGVRVGPLRAADRAEQDGVCLAARLQRSGRQRLAVAIDGDAPDIVFLEPEGVTETGGDGLQHRHGGGGDFRTDAVTRQYDNLSVHVHSRNVQCQGYGPTDTPIGPRLPAGRSARSHPAGRHTRAHRGYAVRARPHRWSVRHPGAA